MSPHLGKWDPAVIGGWTDGVLRFKDQPLVEVLEQIKLIYPELKVSLEGGDVSFSGTLVVTDAETMLLELSEFTGMMLAEDSNVYILRPKL